MVDGLQKRGIRVGGRERQLRGRCKHPSGTDKGLNLRGNWLVVWMRGRENRDGSTAQTGETWKGIFGETDYCRSRRATPDGTGAGERSGVCLSGWSDGSGALGVWEREGKRAKSRGISRESQRISRKRNRGGMEPEELVQREPRGRASRTRWWSEPGLLAATMRMPKDPFGYDSTIFFWGQIKSRFCEVAGPER